MQNEIHVDATFNFVVTIQDSDGVLDVSDATSKYLLIKKSDDTVLTKNMSFLTDGTEGKLKYVIADGDLDIPGLYKYQVLIITPDYQFYSDIGQFRVYPNLGG